jgi:hypothetical protein
MADPEDLLERAVETYNRYRGSVATATIRDVDADRALVRFEGSFCTTCCRDDYFEDLVYELVEFGVDASDVRVTEIRQVGLETFDVAFRFESGWAAVDAAA